MPPFAASHGCVRAPRYDARWLYDQTPNGTKVDRPRELDVRRLRVLLAVALLALAAAAPAQAADPLPTLVPDTLTVGLQMPTQGFQVGSVVGPDVVYARGLEVDLARALAQRMGLPNVRFVQERSFAGIFTHEPEDVGRPLRAGHDHEGSRAHRRLLRAVPAGQPGRAAARGARPHAEDARRAALR